MKSKIKSILMVCLALTSTFFASCTDDTLVEVSEKYADRPFELTVSQNSPESRLELGQDGLKTMWEPGDKLVLIDKSRSLAPIYLTCTLEEKSDKATFVSESGVPSGDYYVIYNYNQYLVYGHKPLQTINKINEKDDLVLYEELNIPEGSSSATISLKHMYAKIRVALKNVQSECMEYNVGMYSSKKGFPIFKLFTNNGLENAEYGYNPNSINYNNRYGYFSSNKKFHNLPLGKYSSSGYSYDEETGKHSYDFSKTESHSALILPADLRGEDVFFYLLSGNTCYEFKKAGIEFKAGKSYKVVLDMNEAVVSTLSSNYNNGTNYYQLTNAKDWRHAAYKFECNVWENSYSMYKSGYYELTNDIDFTDEYFFPIQTSELKGNNHTLSNIKLEWPEEDNVGLIRHEWGGEGGFNNIDNLYTSCVISDLTIEDATIKGNNFVGAFGGWNIMADNCELIGNSSIQANGNYVGGIVGCNTLRTYKSTLNDVRVGQSCEVSGKNYVGGIVGRYVNSDYEGNALNYSCPSIILLESCKSEATVSATEDYVGGIFGKIGGSISSNYSDYTDINFSMEDYTFSLVKCVNEGDVSGRHHVGGIGGDFAVASYSGGSTLDRVVLSQSCNNGNVSGDSSVGGILGTSYASANICYSTGNVSASTSMVGGIVGNMSSMMYGSRIANCYSLAKLTVGENGYAGGIIGSAGFMTITNCYYAANPSTYRYGGIVGNSGGATSIVNCLTTLETLCHNLGDHEEFSGKRDWVDQNNDGIADWDYNGDNVIDNFDLYEYYYKDNVTNSISAVTSILDNISVINGGNAYSTNIWPLDIYPWHCVKFASFSAETDSPDYDEETYQ